MSFRHFPCYSLLLVLLLFAGCITAPPQPPLVPAPPAPLVSRYSALLRLDPNEIPSFKDDLDTASLHTSALQSLAYYESLPDDRHFIFGSDTYTVRDLTASMAYLVSLLERSPDR